jgi:hypothetical protein
MALSPKSKEAFMVKAEATAERQQKTITGEILPIIGGYGH